ncbi:MAG: serpin family protein [Planctomycetota bacterium]
MTTLAMALLPALLPIEPLRAQSPTQEQDVQRLSRACNQFGERLYAELEKGGNPTCSPASIASALLMLLPGARNETADELATALQLPKDLRGERLLKALVELMPEAEGTLRVRNDVWLQQGFELVPAYTDLLSKTLHVEPRTVDFAGATETARVAINRYIADVTNDRVQELLQRTDIDASTSTVLTNAIWFKAAWRNAFQKRATKPAPFHLADGSETEVPMMSQTKRHRYAATDAWRCVEMQFGDAPLRFEAIVPEPGQTLADARSALLAGTHLDKLADDVVHVRMPSFRIKARHSLQPALEALGMRRAFGASADFTNMDASGRAHVGAVLHETWIQVDEEGCEAAAATAVVMKRAGARRPVKVQEITFDRPFVFGLRDAKTGLLWFVGQVDDPRAK